MRALRERIHLPAGQSFRVLRWSRDLSEVEVVTAGGKSAKTAGVGAHWHHHVEMELTWFARGQGTRFVGDHIAPFAANDVVLLGHSYGGLVATGVHPSPFPHAHIVTTTTHKTLRGPRGGLILTNDEELSKKIDRALFPGAQGGPLMHVIASKAVAFGEALKPEFRAYAQQVVRNAQTLAFGAACAVVRFFGP